MTLLETLTKHTCFAVCNHLAFTSHFNVTVVARKMFLILCTIRPRYKVNRSICIHQTVNFIDNAIYCYHLHRNPVKLKCILKFQNKFIANLLGNIAIAGALNI